MRTAVSPPHPNYLPAADSVAASRIRLKKKSRRPGSPSRRRSTGRWLAVVCYALRLVRWFARSLRGFGGCALLILALSVTPLLRPAEALGGAHVHAAVGAVSAVRDEPGLLIGRQGGGH